MDKNYKFIFFNIGFTGLITQILFLREFITVFYGNELCIGIILGNWLLWTAGGSWISGKIVSAFKKSFVFLSVLISINIIIIPASVIGIRSSREIFNSVPGEIIGLIPVFITTFLLMLPFCFINGSIFSVSSHILSVVKKKRPESAIGNVYFWEGLGAGAGGLIANFILIRYFNSLHLSLFMSALNLMILLILLLAGTRVTLKNGIIVFGSTAAFIVLSLFFSDRLEEFSINLLWKNYTVAETENTVYGNITVTVSEDQYNFFENGLFLFSTGDVLSAEEFIHFPLLEHPEPKTLLLFGGGLNGSIEQALRHPSLRKVDYIELDPEMIALGKKYSPELEKVLSNSAVNVYNQDGRAFINQTTKKYDVIIVNLPEPYTIQINRFYTVEFFKKVQSRLNPGGIFSFNLTSSENVIGDVLAEFLSIMYSTLKKVFPETIVIPGNVNHFIACTGKNILTEDFTILIERINRRNLNTAFINEFYLPFRMSDDRIKYIKSTIKEHVAPAINSDFKPVGYYYDLILWSTQFSQNFKHIFLTLKKIDSYYYYLFFLLISLFLIVFFLFLRNPVHRVVPAAVAIVGFSAMVLELVIIFGFQIIYGYIYSKITMLIAGYMVGLCAGSACALYLFKKKINISTLFIVIQFFIAGLPLLIYTFFSVTGRDNNVIISSLSTQVLFPALMVVTGFTGGLHFTLSNRIYFRNRTVVNPGTLYAVDLAGAFIGSVMVSSFLIPLTGIINSCYHVAYLNILAGILLLISIKKEK